MLVVTYRESLRHGPQPFSGVVVRRSLYQGRTWEPKRTVVERTKERTNGQRVEKREAAAGVRDRSLTDHAGQGNVRCLVDRGLSQGTGRVEAEPVASAGSAGEYVDLSVEPEHLEHRYVLDQRTD